MRSRNIRLSIVLLISIMFTTLVYGAFNTQLQIEGEAIVRSDQEIRITNITATNTTNGAYETYNNKYGKDTTSMYVLLPSSSSITYEVQITNKVSDSYLIESIDELSNTNSNVNVDISLNANDVVNSNSTKTFTITISNSTENEQEETLVYKYGFKLNKFTVTFDANGGSVSTSSKEVSYGSAYGELPTPTRTGCTFKGWNGKNLFNFTEWMKLCRRIEGGTIVKNNNNISLTSNNSSAYTITYYAPTMGGYGDPNSLKIYLKKNTTYTLSWKTTLENQSGMTIFLDDKHEAGYIHSSRRGNLVFTTYNDSEFIRVRFDVYGLNNSATFSNVMLEEGSTATSYEPYYIEDTTTVVQLNNHTLTAIWEDSEAPTLTLSKETYIEDDFSGWTFDNAYVDSEGSLVLGEDGNTANSFSRLYNVNGDFWYPTFDAYSNNTTTRGVNWVSEYFDDNMNPAFSLEGYKANGWAIGFSPLNTWVNNILWQNSYNSKTSWSAVAYPRYGPDIKYVKLNFAVAPNNSWSKPMTKIRNLRIYGETIPSSFYNINITSSDNEGIVTTKYAKGNYTSDYFENNGTELSSNQIRVTENGTYTVYVADAAGNKTVQTIEITNIQ